MNFLRGKFDDVLLWMGINSRGYSLVSLTMATVIVFWDFIVNGARGFFDYKIGVWGVVGLMISLGLMWLARYVDNEFRVE